MLPNPYVMLGALIVVAGLVLGAFFYGRKTGEDHIRAGELAAERAAVQQLQAENAAANARAKKLEEVKAQQVVIYKDVARYVDKVATRPGADRVCLDADSVSAVNAALGASPLDPRFANGGMPATQPAQ